MPHQEQGKAGQTEDMTKKILEDKQTQKLATWKRVGNRLCTEAEASIPVGGK